MKLGEEDYGKYFIAAQAPNSYGVASFFRMLMEERVKYVFTIGDAKQVKTISCRELWKNIGLTLNVKRVKMEF
jgi:protein tyrosine phosphatase